MQIPFTDPGNILGVVMALYPGYFLILTTAPLPRLVIAFDRQDLKPGQGEWAGRGQQHSLRPTPSWGSL